MQHAILNEQATLQKLSEGDPEALKTLILAYFPLLCSFAEKCLPDESLAKDIVQETFIKLWQHEEKFESINGLASFLFTVTKNGCLNLRRTRERENQRYARLRDLNATEQVDAHSDEIAWLNSLAAINLAMQQLPAKMQEIFMLSFRQGLSNSEIARKLNISEKTVRNQKYNSLTLLRARLTEPGNSYPLLLLALLLSGKSNF